MAQDAATLDVNAHGEVVHEQHGPMEQFTIKPLIPIESDSAPLVAPRRRIRMLSPNRPISARARFTRTPR